MATRISDVIEPITFANYVIERTRELSALIEAGIVTQDATLNSLVVGGGRTVNMPMWAKLTGESEILSDTTPLTPRGITTKQDIAVQHFRGNAWSANALASAVAGSSAMTAIGNQVANYWVKDEQRVLISTLRGVFDSPTMSNHRLVVTEGISAPNVLRAKNLLGDAAGQLTAMAVHSMTMTLLQIQNLIVYIPNARGEVVIPTYLGYRLIVDDMMPFTGNTFDTYLFADGVIGRGDGIPVDGTPVETDRDSLQDDDYLINRRYFVLHPFGVRWVGTSAGLAPTNNELATGANWEKVYDDKNIGMVLLRHTVTL